MYDRRRKIGIGVIGLGMGRSHLEAYQNNPHAEVVGICDTRRDKLELNAKKYNAPFTATDYRKLLEIETIQAVSIATPDHLHAEQAVAAMKAGKDVLCEKPLALSLKDCHKIIAVSQKTGRRVMVGQVCRFTPGFQMARKMVVEGKIGELFFVESEYAHNYEGHAEGIDQWRKSKKVKREPFVGGGCHAVDLLRWIAGEPEEAFAYANHKCLKDWPVNDCTIAIFRFQKNIIGKVYVSIGCKRPYTMRTCIYGTEGTIICDNTSPRITLFRKNHDRKKFKGEYETIAIPVAVKSHNIQKEVDVFIDAICRNKPVETNAREGARTVAVCLAAVASARCGRPIRIPKGMGEE